MVTAGLTTALVLGKRRVARPESEVIAGVLRRVFQTQSRLVGEEVRVT